MAVVRTPLHSGREHPSTPHIGEFRPVNAEHRAPPPPVSPIEIRFATTIVLLLHRLLRCAPATALKPNLPVSGSRHQPRAREDTRSAAEDGRGDAGPISRGICRSAPDPAPVFASNAPTCRPSSPDVWITFPPSTTRARAPKNLWRPRLTHCIDTPRFPLIDRRVALRFARRKRCPLATTGRA